MLTMTKRLEFDAGHRLVNHESKCAHVHGHRYAVEVTLSLALGGLDCAGRIVDFSEVKNRLGAWIDDKLDHGFIANASDTALIEHLQRMGSKVFVFDGEPSAENIAVMLLGVARDLLQDMRVNVVRVVVFETPTSSAEAS